MLSVLSPHRPRGGFKYCHSLVSVTIPDGVTAIGSSAFYGCGSLTDVTIPASLANIGSNAFGKCSSLKDVYYGGSEAEWNELTMIFRRYTEELERATVHCAKS